jgi:hypothetical protein
MKNLRKYAIVAAALLGGAVVYAQGAKTVTGMKHQRADQVKKDADTDNRHVLHLQALARKEKDVIKLTCINDKLVQIKAQMNLLDTSALQLDGEEAAASRALEDVEKAGSEVKKLRSDADVCAGELEMYKQESKSDFQAPDLDDPTSGGPFESAEQLGEPDIDQPAYATPFS